ncbi:MAG TPA: teicoplanin resistance protein VanZ [Elusimicrobia bacterium]|jgi:VanZ family protein|nr:teicoplanin resistance protein VanZ [Elusimicrobiota bacterium]
MYRFLRYWSPVLIWCSIIFYFSNIPHLSSGLGVWDLFLRKVVHLTEYGVLSFLLMRAFRNTSNLSLPDLSAWSLRLSILYAFTDELHQGFVPGRENSVYDLFIDSLGAVIALWLLTWKEEKKKSLKDKKRFISLTDDKG